MTELSVTNCTVAFGGLRAIDDLSVTIPEGSITALIGPNGSGKTTFCNMVSGYIPPSKGEIRLGGEAVTALRTDRLVSRGLARTFQVPRVPKELTIAEVVGVPLRYSRSSISLPKGVSDARDLARFCGLNQPLDTECSQLSISDLRRLEIARALACRPKVVLLDEAMAGLSMQDTEAVMGLVRQVHAAGITIVVIEHVMKIIAKLCQHAIVLSSGRLLAKGEPSAVLADPAVREAYLGKGFSL